MDLHLDRETRDAIELVRSIGKEFLRPLGLEADRLGRAIPADHPFYKLVASTGYMERGMGGDGGRDAPGDGRRTGAATRGVLVAEEGSYWDRGAMVSLPGPGLGGPPVTRMGTPEQRERFMGIFRQRDQPRWAAFAMTEPGAGSDVARIATRARRDGDEWVLDGQKFFSSNSPRAAWVVVFATVDPDQGRAGHRAFVVEQGTPGFEIVRVERKMGLRAYETASFALDGCRVPAANLLGGDAYYDEAARRGFEGAMAAFNATRPMIAAMAIGIARAAHDTARDFVLHDYPMGATRHRRKATERLGEMRRHIEVGRLMCVRAAWMADAGLPNVREASAAKLYCPPVALAAVQAASEVLGEAGVVADRLVEKLARDVKALDIVEGTQQVQRRVVARHVVGRLDPQ